MLNKPPHYYIQELRTRLLSYASFVCVLLLILFYFSKSLYTVLALPLIKQMQPTHQLIATQIAAPLITPLKLAWTCTLFLSIPIALYHLWAFITPALYKQERKRFWPLLFFSILLFYSGIGFSYGIVFPLLFKFFSQQLPPQIAFMPDMSAYLDFCTHLLFCFGLIFEIPIILLVLVYSGIISPQRLSQCRPYIIVAAFIVGMLLTPPDIISQILLAVPMCLLYEIGLVLSKRFVK